MSELAAILAKQFRRHADELPGADRQRIVELRRAAFDQFEEIGIPTLRHEDWKYTDIRVLRETDYIALEQAADASSGDVELSKLPFPEFTRHVAVFLDGQYCPRRSTLDGLPKEISRSTIGGLLEQGSNDIAKCLRAHETAFPSLNSAFLKDGLFIEIAANTTLSEPIHVIFLSTPRARPHLNTARLIIKAGPNSSCQFVESHYSLDGASNLTNALTEIEVHEGASVKHYRIQIDNPSSHHIGNVFATAAQDACIETYSFAFGGGITRIDVNADLIGRGSQVVMNGLFMVNDGQHIDHHTRVRHRVGDTRSTENYKGIVDGNGRGVFNGKILVERDAQKIDARQSSKSLLLSDNAEIDTKPQLEIYADDVKCAHGATVGRLDEDAYFYLRSRGIDAQTARSILTFAFAADIAEGVKIAPLREWLENVIRTRTHTTDINEIEDRG